MENSGTIVGYVFMRQNEIWADGDLIFKVEGKAEDFFSAAYSNLGIQYPKFYKMDNLSKTGFIAAEYLLKNRSLAGAAEEKGMVFATANGSLDVDLKYQSSTSQIASPALFVYTLPNIVSGEICIRNVFKGETACFVFNIFDASFIHQYIGMLLEEGRLQSCLAGWCDFVNGDFEAFFYLIEKGGKQGLINSVENIQSIYEKHGGINKHT